MLAESGALEGGADILVVCTENVCRSVFASSLLAHAWRSRSIVVTSAGLAARGLGPCPQVLDRLDRLNIAVIEPTGRQVDSPLLDARLVLTATVAQRSHLTRSRYDVRERCFTIAEAVHLAESGRVRSASASAASWAVVLNKARPMVAPADPISAGPWWRRRVQNPYSINDGHLGTSAEHRATLDSVHSLTTRLVAALDSPISAK